MLSTSILNFSVLFSLLLFSYVQTSGLPFIALGDWGLPISAQNADILGDVAQTIGSKFVLALGDNFYPLGVKSIMDPQWQNTFENVYVADSLQTPWNVVAGNQGRS